MLDKMCIFVNHIFNINNIMELSEIIENRYSCRDYTSETVGNEQLEYIKECVRLAPSAVTSSLGVSA